MKKMKFWGMLMLVAMALPMMMACGGSDKDDDDDGGGGGGSSKGIIGWYGLEHNLNGGPIETLEMSYDYGAYLTINGRGEIIETSPNLGNIEKNVSTAFSWFRFYNIVNSNTIVEHTGGIYEYGASAAANKELLYKFYYAPLGTLAIYSNESRYYTYWEDEGKLYTEYDIFTIMSDKLIPDGSSMIFIKYDRDKTY